MKPSCALFAAMLLSSSANRAAAQALTLERAVQLALERNHDVIAAKLGAREARYDQVQAGLYPNPVLGYAVGNFVLGHGNAQGMKPGVSPGFFDQTVHTVSVSEVIDVWGKRSARLSAAGHSVQFRRLLAEDAVREVLYAVRSAFADVVREQSERQLSHETRTRYDETVRLSRSRFAAGDISEAELKKVELEGLRYENAETQADLELDLARQELAALLALPSEDQLPRELEANDERRESETMQALVDRALARRPDIRAAKEAALLSEAALAQAKREAYPDISLGVAYSHSEFTVSGDNPNSLGLSLAFPLPLFDRNQANVGRAEVERLRAENEGQRLLVQVKYDVAQAYRRLARAQTALRVFEGGMLERAESSLSVAEKSYRAGGISLLELLEAQRTYLETRAEYLRAVDDYRQATIDMLHAVGEGVS